MALKLKYPIGIETFSDIIEGGYVYVDKTAYIPMLLDSGKQYFLSRPRRFGKSLGLPNKEVAESFSCALLPIYSGYMARDCDDRFYKMRSAVIDGEAERFMELLKTFLEGNPYGNTELAKRETYFKNNIFLIFKALGFRPRAEEESCRARMDVMLETRRFVYIFELKTDGKVEEAYAQIEERGYAEPYRHLGKTIIRIAANYSPALNNIGSWNIDRE